ncbi:MAG TPA: inositol monophosphatase family protein [Candidatus Binataceae bacterium]|nr:inositol monophosphatase family protein [Candidatus Binataceae bacterium]
MADSIEIQKVALRAARAAARVHLKWLSRTSVTRKSNSIDLVTEADQQAEATVIDILQRAFPTHAILAEESGTNAHQSEHRWIIDPLDGTTNFAHGYPQFCVSIAYEYRGKVRVAIILDSFKKECFVAQRGRGAHLNGKAIHVSPIATLDSSLLATGFPYDRRERRHYYLTFWEAFMMRVQGVRRTGSAALDLAYAACGRTDGFWEFGLKPWDVAAGALIVEEAGGLVSNMDGSPLDLAGGQIVASNGRLHQPIIEVLATTRAEAERRQAEMRRDADSPAQTAAR